jgi:hypothetical protein
MKSGDSSRPPMGKKSLSSRFLEKLGMSKKSGSDKKHHSGDQKIDSSTLLNRTQSDQLYLKSNAKRKNSDPIHSTPKMINQEGSLISNSDHGVYLEQTTHSAPPTPQANDIFKIMSLDKEIQSKNASPSVFFPSQSFANENEDGKMIQRENSRMSSVSSLTATSPENSPTKPTVEERNKLRMASHSRSRDQYYSSSDSEGEAPLATLRLPTATKFVKKDDPSILKQPATTKKENLFPVPATSSSPVPSGDDPGERLKQRIAIMNSYIKKTSSAGNSQPVVETPSTKEDLPLVVAAVVATPVGVSESLKSKIVDPSVSPPRDGPPHQATKDLKDEERGIVETASRSEFTDLTQDQEGAGDIDEDGEDGEGDERAEENGPEDHRREDDLENDERENLREGERKSHDQNNGKEGDWDNGGEGNLGEGEENDREEEEGEREDELDQVEERAVFEDDERDLNELSRDSPMLRQEDTLSFRSLSTDSQPDLDYSSDVNENKFATPAARGAGAMGADDQSNNITDSTLIAEQFIHRTPSSSDQARSPKFQSPPEFGISDLSPVVQYPPQHQHSLSFISEGEDDDEDDDDTLFNSSSSAMNNNTSLVLPTTPLLPHPPHHHDDDDRGNDDSLESHGSGDHNSLKKIHNLNELLFAEIESPSPVSSPAAAPASSSSWPSFLLEDCQQQPEKLEVKPENDDHPEDKKRILTSRNEEEERKFEETVERRGARERVLQFAKIIEKDHWTESEAMIPWRPSPPLSPAAASATAPSPLAAAAADDDVATTVEEERKEDLIPKNKVIEVTSKTEREVVTVADAESDLRSIPETGTRTEPVLESNLAPELVSDDPVVESVVDPVDLPRQPLSPQSSLASNHPPPQDAQVPRDSTETEREVIRGEDESPAEQEKNELNHDHRQGQDQGQGGQEDQEIEKYFKLGGLLAQTSNLATHSSDEIHPPPPPSQERGSGRYRREPLYSNTLPTTSKTRSAPATSRSWNSFSSSSYQIISLPDPPSASASSSSFMMTTPKKHLRFSPNLHSQPSLYLTPAAADPPPPSTQRSSRRWSPKYSRYPHPSALIPAAPSDSDASSGDLDSLYFFLGNVYAGVSVKCSVPQHEPSSSS